MKSLLQRIAWIAALFTACTPSKPISDGNESNDVIHDFAWIDSLKYDDMTNEHSDARKIKNIANKNCRRNEKPELLFRLGNLYFVRIKRRISASDAPITYRSIAISPPNFIFNLPNDVLFQHFSTEIRKNPEVIALDERLTAMLLLATGNSHIVNPNNNQSGVWEDNGDTLTIEFKRLQSNGGMRSDSIEDCRLIVDNKHNHRIECLHDSQ